jgi:hypothetical protein
MKIAGCRNTPIQVRSQPLVGTEQKKARAIGAGFPG